MFLKSWVAQLVLTHKLKELKGKSTQLVIGNG
jgi:hypothetical protein